MSSIRKTLKAIGHWWLDRHPQHLDHLFDRWA